MRHWLLYGFPLCALWCASASAAPTTPSTSLLKLRCEDVNNPLGVEQMWPILSWAVQSSTRGWHQSAYRILVASSPTLLAQNKGDLWDSGRVKSDATTQIAYSGQPLSSRRQCFWKVQAWDNKGATTPFSAPAKWEMGLLQKTDWHGKWIGYAPPATAQAAVPTLESATWIWYPEGDPLRDAPEQTRYFRRGFDLPTGRTVTSAVLRVAADNSATINVNGQEVGQSHDSWKTRDIFDVTKLMRANHNVMAISVANEGTAAGLAAQLDVHFATGNPITIVTDGKWKSNTQEIPTWDMSTFDDSKWVEAKEVVKVGGGPWGKIENNINVPAPPAPMLRKTFQSTGKIKRATAYICGLGYYELHINGKKVGDHVLDPGWTRYDRRHLYVTHDVTSYLKNGTNAVGVILGTGHYDDHVLAVWDFDHATWRTLPKMLLELRLDYEDGHHQTVTSDGTWKGSTGPIIFDSISAGETYDARLEKAGWDTAAYKDAAWQKAEVTTPVNGLMAAQIAPPIRVTSTITPVKVTQPTPGVWIFDLGQNFAGVPQLRIQGPAGTKVAMRCAEKLHKDGTLDGSNIDYFLHRRDPNQAFQTDTYILKGKGQEIWQPGFTYHGFQYVEVKGFPGTPTVDNLRGMVMHSDFDSVGNFECSNPTLNHVQKNARWSYVNNFYSIPTDCPQREKNGWTGDAHLAAEMGLYNFDGAANYKKWLNDIADEQGPDGSYAAIIPTSGWGYNEGPAWDSVYPLIVWYLYEYRGDKALMAKHYPHLQRYLQFLTSKSKDGIVDYGLGDWCPAKTQTPAEITSTGYYYADSILLAKMAAVLGKTDDEKMYTDKAAGIKAAFNAKFYHPETGEYGNGSLTSLSCALYQGLVEPENKAQVVDNLIAEVKKQNYHMDVGILGAKYLLTTLVDTGHADVAYQILQQRGMPSYAYWIDQGATTLWEDWDGHESLDHIMFGDVSAWFYKNLAGINAAAPGFKQIVIKPHVLGDMTYAKASYDSMQGRILSDWKLTNGTLNLNVTIPGDVTATVYVPNRSGGKVSENGVPAEKATGVKWLRDEDGYSVFAVGSGDYKFAAK